MLLNTAFVLIYLALTFFGFFFSFRGSLPLAILNLLKLLNEDTSILSLFKIKK